MRWKIVSCVVLLILSLFARQAMAFEQADCGDPVISVQALRAGSSLIEVQDPDLAWMEVQLPDHWTTRWPGYSGSVWYRIQWHSDCPPEYWARAPLALAIDSINMAGRVFVNGDLLWQDTNLVEPLSRSWNRPRLWTLPGAAVKQGVNVILVEVRGVAMTMPGLGKVHVGNPQILLEHQRRLNWDYRGMFTVNIMGALSIAILFLGMWLFYRKTTLYLWFVLLNLCWVAFLYNVIAMEAWPFPSTVAVQRANAIAFMSFCLCFTNFIFQLARRPLSSKMATVLTAFTVIVSVVIALCSEQNLGLALKIGIRGHLLIFAMTCVTLAFIAWRSKKAEDCLYGSIGIVYVGIAFHDWRIFYFQLETAPLTPYANLLTMTGIAIIMGLRIAHSMRRIEQFNEELRISVQTACEQLEQSLHKKHELALTTIKLQERVELIQDIHDGFGSALVRAIAQAESTTESHHQKNRHISTLKSLRDDLRLVIDSGRSFVQSPPQSPQGWMAPTRYQFSSLFDNIGMKSQWQLPPEWPSPPCAMTCLTMTRFLEEALSNVLKHSQASEVSVSMAYPVPDRIVLEVCDNGIGFDVAAVRHAAIGVGMESMHARIEKLGGSVEIHSCCGCTLVRGTLPVYTELRGQASGSIVA